MRYKKHEEPNNQLALRRMIQSLFACATTLNLQQNIRPFWPVQDFGNYRGQTPINAPPINKKRLA
jgi:hypothetical protein